MLRGRGGSPTRELQGKPMTWERTGLPHHQRFGKCRGHRVRAAVAGWPWRGDGGVCAHREMGELAVGLGSGSKPDFQ